MGGTLSHERGTPAYLAPPTRWETWLSRHLERRRVWRVETKVIQRLWHRGVSSAWATWVGHHAEQRRARQVERDPQSSTFNTTLHPPPSTFNLLHNTQPAALYPQSSTLNSQLNPQLSTSNWTAPDGASSCGEAAAPRPVERVGSVACAAHIETIS